MAHSARMFTSSEAAAVSGLARKAIDNAIDKKLIPRPTLKDGSARERQKRRISETDLVWIYVNSEAPGVIPAASRKPLYELLSASEDAGSIRVSDLVLIDFGEARRRIEAGALALERAKASIVCDPEILGGEPVFEGTRVTVYEVAASLSAGFSPAEIMEAYSGLGKENLEQARLYALAFPPRGRPRQVPRIRPPSKFIERKTVPLRKA